MNGRKLLIRPALPPDLRAMLRIAESSPESPAWPASAYLALFDEQRTAVHRTTLVTEVAGETVAFGVLATVSGMLPLESEIENLAVNPAHRRQGIGGAVLAALLARADEFGQSIVRLEVRASNAGALALYLRAGFRETGRRTGYYSSPIEDAVMMERGHATSSGIISATYGS